MTKLLTLQKTLQNVYKGSNYKDIPYKSKPLHSSNRGDTTETAREGRL